jgi:NAD(P)-dependent dehydrogenase (short-subunit alcohol dehydrogenase family)
MLYQVYNMETDDAVQFGSLRPGVVDTPMQDVIRGVSEDDFPMVDRFRTFKKERQLADPQTVARFIEWVLFDTPDEAFSAGEWDIRDESHHGKWQ